MAQPVVVNAYTGHGNRPNQLLQSKNANQSLPPISSFAFADILRAADCPELQSAIDGIADICAKNRMSLADEYAAHMPPLGEITAATTTRMKPRLSRPGMRTALTSVPEASSGSSEGSRRSKKKSGIFSFRRKRKVDTQPVRRIKIGVMGRTVPIGGTTAYALSLWPSGNALVNGILSTPVSTQRRPSDAETSLHQVLASSSGRHQPGWR